MLLAIIDMYEFYMTVKPDSELYQDYFQWLESGKAAYAAFLDIAEQFGIETTRIYFRPRFSIVPTETDKNKFVKDMLKDGETFKKNSKQNKAWERATQGLQLQGKPNPIVYTQYDFIGTYRYRLFHVGDVLYCSIVSDDKEISLPAFGNEMKASEFYQVVEDLGKRKKEDN